MHSRRQFLAGTAATAAWCLSPAIFAKTGGSAALPLRILILGGTGFLGPACTSAALARGHSVTHFNSGRTEAARRQAGRPSLVPEGVEQLYGNRDPEKTADDRRLQGKAEVPKDPNSPRGLAQLKGKSWDAVIDTSGYFPRMVKASAELLNPVVQQYVFISSISVYKDTSTPGYDETSPTLTLQDPTTEEMGPNYENFGGAKALCETAAEQAMPGRVSVIRPGFIVGPGDTSGRFLYWPVRASMGGEMIIPGRPNDPIQIIDVRDLGEWIVHCLERKVFGVFNATGPAKELSMKSMIKGVLDGTSGAARPTWVGFDFLKQNQVGENQFPLYAPPEGETRGFHRCSIRRALGEGLRFRRVKITARDTLEWYQTLDESLKTRVAPQFASGTGETPWLEREKALLRLWREK